MSLVRVKYFHKPLQYIGPEWELKRKEEIGSGGCSSRNSAVVTQGKHVCSWYFSSTFTLFDEWWVSLSFFPRELLVCMAMYSSRDLLAERGASPALSVLRLLLWRSMHTANFLQGLLQDRENICAECKQSWCQVLSPVLAATAKGY